MSPYAIPAVLLLASLAGNAWLGRAYLGETRALAAMAQQLDTANTSALQCSAGVQDIERERDELAKRAAEAEDLARRRAMPHQAAAQQILATPASAPGDDCKSARERMARWLAGRGKP